MQPWVDETLVRNLMVLICIVVTVFKDIIQLCDCVLSDFVVIVEVIVFVIIFPQIF